MKCFTIKLFLCNKIVIYVVSVPGSTLLSSAYPFATCVHSPFAPRLETLSATLPAGAPFTASRIFTISGHLASEPPWGSWGQRSHIWGLTVIRTGSLSRQLPVTVHWIPRLWSNSKKKKVLCLFLTPFPWLQWKTLWGRGKIWRRMHKVLGKDNWDSDCTYTTLCNYAIADVIDMGL